MPAPTAKELAEKEFAPNGTLEQRRRRRKPFGALAVKRTPSGVPVWETLGAPPRGHNRAPNGAHLSRNNKRVVLGKMTAI